MWVSKKPGPLEPSLVYYCGLLYAILENDILVCWDGKTGQDHYRRRLGGNFNSSPIATDRHIFVSNNVGKTVVVRSNTNFALFIVGNERSR